MSEKNKKAEWKSIVKLELVPFLLSQSSQCQCCCFSFCPVAENVSLVLSVWLRLLSLLRAVNLGLTEITFHLLPTRGTNMLWIKLSEWRLSASLRPLGERRSIRCCDSNLTPFCSLINRQSIFLDFNDVRGREALFFLRSVRETRFKGFT